MRFPQLLSQLKTFFFLPIIVASLSRCIKLQKYPTILHISHPSHLTPHPPLPHNDQAPLPRRPLRQPSLDKDHLVALRLPFRRRRQRRRRLVGEQPVFVPVVHRPLDEDERLLGRRGPILRVRRVRGGRSPRIILPVDKGQSVVTDVVSTVGVDDGRVGRGGDVERVAADDGFVFEGDGA